MQADGGETAGWKQSSQACVGTGNPGMSKHTLALQPNTTVTRQLAQQSSKLPESHRHGYGISGTEAEGRAGGGWKIRRLASRGPSALYICLVVEHGYIRYSKIF